MKLIKIDESQRKRLFEAYREGFSFDELSALGEDGCVAQYVYCVKWLGKPDAFGSSRYVFTLNDNMVLKLAVGAMRKAGIEQNKREYELFKKIDTPLLARILNVDKNFTYVVSESVVPAVEEDFEKILGLPFGRVFYQNSQKIPDIDSKNGGDIKVGYNKYFDNIKKPCERSNISVRDVLSYIEENYLAGEDCYYDGTYENILSHSKWLSDLRDFVEMTGMCDLFQMDNYGVVNRNGKPALVLLDSGFDYNIWLKYYSH